jgi:hypothetical protein
MLQYSNEATYAKLLEQVQQHMEALKNSKNGKKIYTNLLKNYSDLSDEFRGNKKFKKC